MMNIGERIRQLRKRNGINQSTLAMILRKEYGLGTDRVAVSKWETGYQVPGTDAVRSLAMYFGVTADYLMGGEMTEEKCVPMYKNYYVKGEHQGFAVLPHGCDADFCIVACDDSMCSAGVISGGTVFAKSCASVGNGELAVVVINGVPMLRRYYSEGNTIVLVSECGRSVPSIHTKDSKVSVIGKAVAAQCELR